MDTVADMLALLREQPLPQGSRRRPLGIAEVADHAEVGHYRRQLCIKTLGSKPHHVQLASCQAIAGDALGLQRVEIVARTDDHGAGRDAAAAGFEPFRGRAVHHGLTHERDAIAFLKKRCEPWNGLARLDADLVRTVERSGEVCGAQAGAVTADLPRLQQAALGAHLGRHELLEHGPGFRTARYGKQAALQDR